MSILSTLYEDMGNDLNLPVSDTEFLGMVKSTSLLQSMLFIDKEILFVLA